MSTLPYHEPMSTDSPITNETTEASYDNDVAMNESVQCTEPHDACAISNAIQPELTSETI